MAYYKSLCSMPHGIQIVLPFFIATMAFLLSFKILAGCDVVKTQWSINCAKTSDEYCVHVTDINMGFLARETLVLNEKNNDENKMLRVCQWYSDEDKTWLWDSVWNASFYTHAICTLLGLLLAALLLIPSCCLLRPQFFRGLAMLFGTLAVLNLTPFLIYWKADVCLQDEPTCNENQSNCIDSCQIGSGSWQLFATSFMWISAMLATWSIPPIKRKIKEDIESQNNGEEGFGSTQQYSNEKNGIHLSGADCISETSSGEYGSEEDGLVEETLDHPSMQQDENINEILSQIRVTKKRITLRTLSYKSDASIDYDGQDRNDDKDGFEDDDVQSPSICRKAHVLSRLRIQTHKKQLVNL